MPSPRNLATETFLETKLHLPFRRPEIVPRARLLSALTDSSAPLVLVAAPAGWGKTTLLADWARGQAGRVAWLSLDPADNDPARFWTYVFHALRTVEPGVGGGGLAALSAPGTGVVEAVLSGLLNELAAVSEAVTLVLDDYHLVTNAEIHEAVAFLIEHAPPRLRFALGTRTDPALPLGRLRARGELTEIRSTELRFSADEAEMMLNGGLDLRLPPADAERLQVRTEGWAAGLYLAALSLVRRTDPSRFVADFTGDDRNVVDYLGSEVMGQLPDDMRRFLLRTSILTRLCASLCDAVTGEEGSARMLERIERQNLFLVPLDTRRRWYRYHHLFADLLRHELDRESGADLGDLHRRAAIWCAGAGSVDDAIRHATAAGDTALAGDLISRHWLAFLEQARPDTVVGWVDALPSEAVAADTRLQHAWAGAGLFLGRLDEIARWLEAPPAGTALGPLWHGVASLESGREMIRTTHRYLTGDLGATVDAARQFLSLEADGSPYWRAVINSILGPALYLRGAPREAAAALEETLRLDRVSGSTLATMIALGALALVHLDGRETERASALLARAEALVAKEQALGESVACAWSKAAAGALLRDSGRLPEAGAAFARAVELASRGDATIQVAHALLGRASVHHALGGTDQARELVREARRLAAGCPDPGILPDLITGAERELRLAPTRPELAGVVGELSERELAVLRLLAGSCTLREIGDALYISLNTVKTHARSLYRKLDVGSREAAVARARALGLL